MKSSISLNTALALCEYKERTDKGERVRLSMLCAKHGVARSTLWRAIRRGELSNVKIEKIGSRVRYVITTGVKR